MKNSNDFNYLTLAWNYLLARLHLLPASNSRPATAHKPNAGAALLAVAFLRANFFTPSKQIAALPTQRIGDAHPANTDRSPAPATHYSRIKAQHQTRQEDTSNQRSYGAIRIYTGKQAS